jgi:FtsP/CotA-like multicopper oxidase with cupredoxin domain
MSAADWPRLVTAAVVLSVGSSCAAAEAHTSIAPTAWTAGGARALLAQQALPPFATGLPFREPPVVRSSANRLTQTLVLRNGTVEVGGVAIDAAQTYSIGTIPPALLGPTLKVEPGDVIDLVLDNQLTQLPTIPITTPAPLAQPHQECAHDTQIEPGHPQPTNLHFHGLHVTPRNHTERGVTYYGDNVLACLRGGESHIRFKIPDTHDQGTFWYHAHLHGLTNDQVFRGLAGMLLVGDSRRYLPANLRRVATRLLSLKDIQAVQVGERWSIPTDHDWVNPTTRTVNGLVLPKLTIRPRETQLWRLANSSSALWYNLALEDADANSLGLTLVARDGNPLVAPQRLTQALLGPGQRMDVLVRAPQSGTLTLKTLPFDQGRLTFEQADLATVDVTGAPLSAPAPSLRPRKLPTFPSKRGPTRTWRFSFSLTPTVRFMINGKQFDPDRVDARPRLGTTERWILINESSEWHPIHVHQDDFRVRSINGTRVSVRSDQDVVALPPALPPSAGGAPGLVELDMPFQAYSGDFVLHCHILDHEDQGMMARISVRPQ